MPLHHLVNLLIDNPPSEGHRAGPTRGHHVENVQLRVKLVSFEQEVVEQFAFGVLEKLCAYAGPVELKIRGKF